jgi:hypothetical protein
MDLLVVRYLALALCLIAGCAFSQSVTQAPSYTVSSNCSLSNAEAKPSSIACVAGIAFPSLSLSMAGASSPSNNLIYSAGTFIYGTVTAAQPTGTIGPWSFYISGDQVDTQTNFGTGSSLTAFSVELATSTGYTGGRTAFGSYLVTAGVQGGVASSAGNVSATFLHQVNGSFGGTSGYGNGAGGVFGTNCNIYATTAATYLNLINCEEFDVSLPTGASADAKYSQTIVLGPNDAVQGLYDDAGIDFNEVGGTTGKWKNGILFGSNIQAWPFSSTSTLIGATYRTQGCGGSLCPGSVVALNGADFSAVTFQSGGCSFKSTGFCVDPSGNITANNVKPVLSGTTASIGGGALLAGGCSTGTVTVTGATTSMAVVASPTTYPGAGAYWQAYVSSANTVTVGVCATIALTPTASTYNVRILQ